MIDRPSLVEAFRTEALEHVQALEEEILKLERSPSSPQPLRRMFLAAHTIKGGAAMLELGDLRDLARTLEDVLGAIRDGRHTFHRATADLFLRGADLLRTLILTPDPEPFRGDVADLERELHQLIESESLSPVQQAPGSPPDILPAAISRQRALVVDDSPVVRMIETALLEEASYEVSAVADGHHALRLLREQPFALLVTGIETRGIGGLGLARAARESSANPGLAIIVVTGGGSGRTSEEAAGLDITAWLPKGPEGQAKLLEIARELRERSQARRR